MAGGGRPTRCRMWVGAGAQPETRCAGCITRVMPWACLATGPRPPGRSTATARTSRIGVHQVASPKPLAGGLRSPDDRSLPNALCRAGVSPTARRRIALWASGGIAARPGMSAARSAAMVAAVSPAVAPAQIASGGDGSGGFRFPAEGLPRHLPEIRPGCRLTGQVPVRAWRQARAGHRGPSRSGQARGPAATGSPAWSPGPASGHRSATGRQRRQAWCRDR